MEGNINKCEIGDLILYRIDKGSFDWQNDVYMILKVMEAGWVEVCRMSLIQLENFKEDNYLATSCINIESPYCTLVKKNDIFKAYNKKYK